MQLYHKWLLGLPFIHKAYLTLNTLKDYFEFTISHVFMPCFFFLNAFSVGGGAHFSNNIKMSTKIMLGAKNLTVCSCTRGVIRIVLVAPVYSITSLESGSGAGYFQGAISKNVSGTQLSDPTLRLCPHSQSMEED